MKRTLTTIIALLFVITAFAQGTDDACLFSQTYYTSADLNSHASAKTILSLRESNNRQTLYLHSYYLTDYMESDIPQEFLDRLDANMNALRDGGGKVIVRFSYKSSMERTDQPWNATEEWIHKHIQYLVLHSHLPPTSFN